MIRGEKYREEVEVGGQAYSSGQAAVNAEPG
jgi:hypothetical protein